MKNCSRTQWIMEKLTTALSDCRAWTTNDSNLGIIAIRSTFHSLSMLTWCVLRKTESDREDASSYTYQQHEAFNIGYYAIFVQRYIIVISIPSRWSIALYSVICATIPRLGTSCKKYCIHPHAHENIAERTEAYRSATRCHICEKPFASDDTRVCDYYHLPPIDTVIQRIQTVT